MELSSAATLRWARRAGPGPSGDGSGCVTVFCFLLQSAPEQGWCWLSLCRAQAGVRTPRWPDTNRAGAALHPSHRSPSCTGARGGCENFISRASLLSACPSNTRALARTGQNRPAPSQTTYLLNSQKQKKIFLGFFIFTFVFTKGL